MRLSNFYKCAIMIECLGPHINGIEFRHFAPGGSSVAPGVCGGGRGQLQCSEERGRGCISWPRKSQNLKSSVCGGGDLPSGLPYELSTAHKFSGPHAACRLSIWNKVQTSRQKVQSGPTINTFNAKKSVSSALIKVEICH